MQTTHSICWFRLDLRLDDNLALRAAAAQGGPVVPIFIWAPEEESPWEPGVASRWWLHHSLAMIDSQLRRGDSRLILRRGPAAKALLALARETGATTVYYNRRVEPAIAARDAELDSQLRSAGLKVESFDDAVLYKPQDVLTASRAPFQVFTPFWRACQKLDEPPKPEAAPARLPAPANWPDNLELEDLALEPSIDWAGGMRDAWQPGTIAGHLALSRFAQSGLADYAAQRDCMEPTQTSRLSPYLHFGEISPRRLWHEIKRAAGGKPGGPLPQTVEPYLRQLGWREFAHYLLHHFPRTPREPLRREFANFPWDVDPSQLVAWQQGRTGYPLVDAAMRQLWKTGWMHNRARMIVASFLIKDLLISWVEGARWFWNTLLDADLANNTLGWQWVAGCGADAAPFFRVFNPVLQGQKFDPNGAYVRRWVPELAQLPSAWVHRPWDAPSTVLAQAGVELDRTYPRPIVDHKAARQRTLEAFRSIRHLDRGPR